MKPPQPPVLTAFAAWLQTAVRLDAVRKDLLDEAARAWAGGVDYHVVIGEALTRSGAPVLVHVHMGELFVFFLQETHARMMRVDPSGAISCAGRDRVAAPASPQIGLRGLEVTGCKSLDVGLPIRGHCTVDVLSAEDGHPGQAGDAGPGGASARALRQAISWGHGQPVALTMEMFVLNRSAPKGFYFMRKYCHPRHHGQISVGGRFDFEFAPLRPPGSSDDVVVPQTAAAFLTFRRVPGAESSGRDELPVSRPAAVLLTFC